MFSTALLALLLFQAAPDSSPRQPLPYSHKTHVSLGLQCKDCHKNADPGEMMGFPLTATCMGCHQSVKKESPAIQKLTAYAKERRTIPWVRVYQIPGYVFFSHRVHLESGAACRQCHGDVAQRDVLFKEADITMGACMDCHRQHKASTGCTYCHDQRAQ
jgi:hypothetical protein